MPFLSIKLIISFFGALTEYDSENYANSVLPTIKTKEGT